MEPVEEGVWIGLERQMLDEMSARRRLREKTAVRRMEKALDEEEEQEDEVKTKLRGFFSTD